MESISDVIGPVQRTHEQIRSFVGEVERIYLLDRPPEFGVERRSVERMSLTMPVLIQPLDEDLKPLTYEHHAVTRDISARGVGLVTSSPVRQGYVMLTMEPLNGDSFEVLGKIIYCNDLGYYFQSGCEFVVDQNGD